MTVYSQLATLFVLRYNEAKKEGKTIIPSGSVVRTVMLKLYDNYVSDLSIRAITEIQEEEKKELVDECRLTGNKYTNETLTEAAKILYLIKQINDHS